MFILISSSRQETSHSGRGINREDVERGQVLAKPGSVTPHTNFKASVYVLSKEEGGRHTPFFSNYRPQFFFRTTDVTGVIELPAGTEMVMPSLAMSKSSNSRSKRLSWKVRDISRLVCPKNCWSCCSMLK